MGLKKSYRRKGLGQALLQSLEAEARKSHANLRVKTVDQGQYKESDQTISLSYSCGFDKVEVFLNLWDEREPSLLMINKL